MYPVLMTWTELSKPPKCKLPAGFHHMHVDDNGTICTSVLSEERGWSFIYEVEDLLFALMHHLSHPIPYNPAQLRAYTAFATDNGAEYERIAKETAEKYKPEEFYELAIQAFQLQGTWFSLDKDRLNRTVQIDAPSSKHETPPLEPTVPTEEELIALGLECDCSSCLWAASYKGNDLLCLQGNPGSY